MELTGLPGNGFIEEQSLTVKGSGHCTILDVSFSEGDTTPEDKPLSSPAPSEVMLYLALGFSVAPILVFIRSTILLSRAKEEFSARWRLLLPLLDFESQHAAHCCRVGILCWSWCLIWLLMLLLLLSSDRKNSISTQYSSNFRTGLSLADTFRAPRLAIRKGT